MFVALLIFIILVFIVIIIFAFPQFSPVPYFPSNRKDLPLILKVLNLKNNQTIIDLGAGDGSVIFAAAKEAYRKKLNSKFIAIDINPILILIMYIKWLPNPNKKNIKIVFGDMFKNDFINFMNFKNFITVYLYISPWYLEKVIKNLKLQIKNFSVVSYMYKIPNLTPKKIVTGKNKIFLYKI